ncbi:TonB-dependent receptor [Pseudoxanthomonas japonensis]|uniref:TonB-dependent receptor n=1 Tax=Pseudoxanthomonas japonensis TaxID=69284 RepID=A0ABQ6ZGZ9_9GAMM|nr:TonB-dependent receptor [Pseudoxanthomonas japonensis]KAF1725085.1 TonB-dependent receptor [Pseudoxanthomonas japonensis]
MKTTTPHRRTVMSLALATALGASLMAAAPVSAAQTSSTHQFAVGSQPLGDALNRVAQTAGVQIMVPPDLVRGRTAPTLSGQYTVNQALDKVLDGSGLTHRSTRGGVITVARAQETTTPAKAPAPAPKPVPAAADNPPDTQDLAAVQVTGSRIKRAEIEGPSPVTIITAQQIEAEGHATVFEALDSLVMAGGAVETELSGGFSANAHPLNLRGLGPGRSLLLIDGRRAADYPFPYGGRSNFQNFGNIPSGAVERIEVLAGGASAIYGADAVSGVVNIVLKKGYEGDEVKLRGGTSTMGGRDRVDLQWTGGKTGEQWGLTYAFQYYAQELLYGTQRDDWDARLDPTADPRTGVVPPTGLRIRLGADSSSRPLWQFPEGTCEQWGGDFHDTPYLRISGGQVRDMGNFCGYWGDARNQSLSKGKNELAGYLFGTWTFSPDLEGWASLQAWHAKATSNGGFESITGPHTNGVGRIGAFYDPQFGTVIGLDRYLTPYELGGVSAMDQHYKEFSVDVAAGLRGRVGRFDWEATLSHAEYYFERNRRRMVGDRVNEWFFSEQQGVTGSGDPIYQLNLDHWLRPLTAAEYASLSTIAHYEAESWVDTASFVMTGDLFDLPAGPVGSAFIVEASRQGYDMDSDPRVQPDVAELYNLTGTNGGGDRERYALGVEFSIPLHETLKASLAGRYDKYNDITDLGDAKTWNAGLEWRPVDSLLVRGSYATSFKAPDMHWVFSEGSGSFGSHTDALRCISAGDNPDCEGYDFSMMTISRGDAALEEETGKSWGIGFVWDVTDGMSVNVDYWNIELDGAIDLLEADNVLADEAGCRTGLRLDGSPFGFAADSGYCQTILSRVTRVADPGDPNGRVTQVLSGPINQSYLRVAGIDAGFRWRMPTDRFGRFTFGLDWSHTLASERQLYAGDPVDRDWRDDPENLDFRSKAKASVSWRGGDWSANLSSTRYGSLPKLDSEAGRTGVHFLWNANLGKQITDKAKVTFYVNNLFNNLHPEDETNGDFPFFYDAYNPIGREVAVQFEYTFH